MVIELYCYLSNVAQVNVLKNLPVMPEFDPGVGKIPVLGRSPGEGNGYPFQSSCQENSKDRGA